MSRRSLEDVLSGVRSPVELLRNSQIGPYAFPGVPAEFTNWRDEQRAWRESCVLFDQSYHMTDLYIEGPDVKRLLSDLGINSFEGFKKNNAKQFVACNPDGYVIGDAVLFGLEDDRVSLVGRPTAHNWVQYHAENGDYDVEVERDERYAVNPEKRRRLYRYQIQGPNAGELLEKLNGGPLPQVPFFNMYEINIGGRKVRALRHGMSGQPGAEIFGPWEERDEIKGIIVEAGEEYGLKQVGSRTYATNTLESGWIPSPCPAIYTGEQLKPYREWLPANGYEAMASLGGSFHSERIEDYYFTPYELGYGRFVKFDHDFVGREALEEMAEGPHRRKVTLVWEGEDVKEVFASLFEREGLPAKYIDLPLSNYATLPYDRVEKDGRVVGVSTYTGYSYNERSMLSLAVVDEEVAEPGSEVVLLWGEEPNSSKPTVEEHRQVEIRATVQPAPLVEFARTAYRRS
ncbi:Vanillate/3-O-methylgallate O-demethylase [Rubrobacter xylanophilus DSM 9941]|uniref:vanillate/3-O-methylgallate O-demethylase n=1 Tax=Rubrobacter xylanophilus TaxID=49319 RepID=UPI001C63BACF|nr:aminomethyl transferase family protein [Rubrobacter xylanophilus]QYJ14799.1 Vanillate/3-O-methylgallate O-demethylase [Rubrobacter xylanophilus DSM 9941]